MNFLICGTRGGDYRNLVYNVLDEEIASRDVIIEGCCPNSADQYAEEWAKMKNIEIDHHPSTMGNYLRRNINMLGKADRVIAFWDGFSYGTCFVIARAFLQRVPVMVIDIYGQNNKRKWLETAELGWDEDIQEGD